MPNGIVKCYKAPCKLAILSTSLENDRKKNPLMSDGISRIGCLGLSVDMTRVFTIF